MVVVAAVALGSSTYAWFVNNTRVDAQTATLNASTANALYISQGAVGDTSGWTTTHAFAAENATNDHILPVSTTGKNQTTPMTFVKSNAWEINSGNGNKNEVKTYSPNALTGGMNTTFNGTAGADGIEKAIKDGTAEKTAAVDVISADNLDGTKVKQITGITGASRTTLNTMDQQQDQVSLLSAFLYFRYQILYHHQDTDHISVQP